MCGIAGYVNRDGAPADEALLRRMTDAIAHRGPDGEGQLAAGPVGLGHRRLAILDLTDAAAQPMATERGAHVITYNGEVYNFQELRDELAGQGCRFRSRTDSEVVLHAYERWGAGCLERFNGMYAFAVWDREAHEVFLARDRYGVKPLYWYDGGTFVAWASEVKALLQHPAIGVDVDVAALHEYFTFQNVLTDRTLFAGVRILPPGHTLTIPLEAGAGPEPRRWWDFPFGEERLGVDLDEAAEMVRAEFEAAVQRQLVSDVPVGSYLSGGIDSGGIAAVSTRSIARLTTFTGGFDLTNVSGLEMGFDERPAAETMANHYKTEHYEVVLHAGDMEHVVSDLVWHLEDLRVGQSYPNYYVARLAGKFVKVVLSGAGGDELFAGYPWRYRRGIDAAGREQYLGRSYDYWQRLISGDHKERFFRPEVWEAARHHDTFGVLQSVYDGWSGGFATEAARAEAALYFELKTFLHGLLVVEDKLSMAHSLETRVPFLDDRLVDLAVRLPMSVKLRDLAPSDDEDENVAARRKIRDVQTSDGKLVLREAMRSFMPPGIADRRKQGFSAPDATWFRGESIDYVNELLRDPKAAIYDYLDPAAVAADLDAHTSGAQNRRLLIWSLLCFEWWLRRFTGT